MKVFVAWVVDHIDGLVSASLMADNIEELRRVTADVRRATENIKAWAMGVGGSPVLDLGHMGAVEVPADRMTELPEIAEKSKNISEGTLSIGVGMTLAEANVAMRYSKEKGGNQISLYHHDMHAEEDTGNTQKDPLMELGKAQRKGQEILQQPVGFANGPEDAPVAPAPVNPQHGQRYPVEFKSKRVSVENVPSAPTMDAESAKPESHHSSVLSAEGDHHEQQERDHGEKDHEQQQEDQQQEGQQPAQEAQHGEVDPRTAVVQALQQIKQQSVVLQHIKETNPKVFEAVKNVVGAMIIMAQGMAAGAEPSEPTQKSEVELSKAKTKEIDGPTGKFGQHYSAKHGHYFIYKDKGEHFAYYMDKSGKALHLGTHPDHSSALQAVHAHHDKKMAGLIKEELEMSSSEESSEKSSSAITGEESSVVEQLVHDGKVQIEGINKTSLPMPSAKKPHHEYPVGTIKDGKVKVEHRDPATNADGGSAWRSVRAGQVMSEDGHAVSARNPGSK